MSPAKPASAVPTFEVKTSHRRDRSCFVAPDVVAKQIQSGGVTLVDIRTSDNFERLHIPESLNIPLHLIKTKPFLKTNNLVLVNEGRTSNELEDSCRALKQAGFRSVSVLDGGIYQWHQRKLPVQGDATAVRMLNKLKPIELFSERSYDDWAVINLSSSGNRENYKVLPQRTVTLKATAKSIPVAEIRNVIRTQKQTNPSTKIAILADNDAVYERLERELNEPAFYLTGGFTGYKQFVTNQIAMLNEKDKSQKLPSCRG